MIRLRFVSSIRAGAGWKKREERGARGEHTPPRRTPRGAPRRTRTIEAPARGWHPRLQKTRARGANGDRGVP